ncbi:MarR family winged helix-turn-helix transcriptional regulator [Fusibacter ferrireducens]|uniref:MarR family transcriptional regulator n=1 Tax=Fusibacter ferrireducens TaxID=2785058 RepID=A0ABR9ZW82_9FIRM|nr:MarR family transcriptional regulator [Fusibacter ferrireducens]MBF4694712.1 MarR family transcriptional regulator [Fusibacter ferrireducens]
MDSPMLIKHIFATVMLVSRKWEVILNRSYSKEALTLKQFMLLIVLGNAFQHEPTIKEISGTLGTSHQNVKALLVQLERKGFVTMYCDPNDRRVIRVKSSPDKQAYWEERDQKDKQILDALFRGIPKADLEATCRTLAKLDEIAADKIAF